MTNRLANLDVLEWSAGSIKGQVRPGQTVRPLDFHIGTFFGRVIRRFVLADTDRINFLVGEGLCLSRLVHNAEDDLVEFRLVSPPLRVGGFGDDLRILVNFADHKRTVAGKRFLRIALVEHGRRTGHGRGERRIGEVWPIGVLLLVGNLVDVGVGALHHAADVLEPGGRYRFKSLVRAVHRFPVGDHVVGDDGRAVAPDTLLVEFDFDHLRVFADECDRVGVILVHFPSAVGLNFDCSRYRSRPGRHRKVCRGPKGAIRLVVVVVVRQLIDREGQGSTRLDVVVLRRIPGRSRKGRAVIVGFVGRGVPLAAARDSQSQRRGERDCGCASGLHLSLL